MSKVTDFCIDLSCYLQELLMNAVEAGATTINCSINANRTDDILTLSIRDNGTGMNPEVLPRIQRGFYSTKGNDRGTALSCILKKNQQHGLGVNFKPQNPSGLMVITKWHIRDIIGETKLISPGDVGLTYALFVASYENIKISLDFSYENGAIFMLDSEKVRKDLGGVPVSSVIGYNFITRLVTDHLDKFIGGISQMNSLEELNAMRESAKADMSVRDAKGTKVVVAMGTLGINAGARETARAFVDAISENKLYEVAVNLEPATGDAASQPIVDIVSVDGTSVRYKNVDSLKAKRIVTEHLVNGNVCNDLV